MRGEERFLAVQKVNENVLVVYCQVTSMRD